MRDDHLLERRFDKVDTAITLLTKDMEAIRGDVSRVSTAVESVSSDVAKLSSSVSEIQGQIKLAKWIATSALFGSLAVIICWITFASQSVIREIARDVVREELQYRRTVTQYGKFSPDNMTATDPPSFDWTLKTPVDPRKAISITAETLQPLFGIGIGVELGADGKTCRMTLYGDDETLAALSYPIDAKVSISVSE